MSTAGSPQWRTSSYSSNGENCVEIAPWRTSSYSGNGENCVDVAPVPDRVLVRHSKHPDAGTIEFQRECDACHPATDDAAEGIATEGAESFADANRRPPAANQVGDLHHSQRIGRHPRQRSSDRADDADISQRAADRLDEPVEVPLRHLVVDHELVLDVGALAGPYRSLADGDVAHLSRNGTREQPQWRVVLGRCTAGAGVSTAFVHPPSRKITTKNRFTPAAYV